MDLTHRLRARLAAWLVGPAPVREGIPVLFPAFCDQLVRAGLPVWRASLGLDPAPGGERLHAHLARRHPLQGGAATRRRADQRILSAQSDQGRG